MQYKTERKISRDIYYHEGITEERLFREIAFDFLKELPIEKVKKIFNLKAIYATTENLESAYRNADYKKVELLQQLLMENNHLFTGDIIIDD